MEDLEAQPLLKQFRNIHGIVRNVIIKKTTSLHKLSYGLLTSTRCLQILVYLNIINKSRLSTLVL